MKNSSFIPKLFFQLFFLVAIGTPFLSGCKKDDIYGDKKQLIIGKWKGFSQEYEEYTNGTLTDSGGGPAEFDLFLTFKTDGTVIEESYEESSTPVTTTYNYVLNGDKLILSNTSGDRFELTITELNKTNFEFKTEESYTSNGVNYKSVTSSVFKKAS